MLRRMLYSRDIAARDMRYYILPMVGVTLFSLICLSVVSLLGR